VGVTVTGPLLVLMVALLTVNCGELVQSSSSELAFPELPVLLSCTYTVPVARVTPRNGGWPEVAEFVRVMVFAAFADSATVDSRLAVKK
jgi:hypothetical protein